MTVEEQCCRVVTFLIILMSGAFVLCPVNFVAKLKHVGASSCRFQMSV